MKALLAAALLGLACSALQAQMLEGRKEDKAAIQPDKARSVERRDRHRRQRDERPVERETSQGTFKLDRVRPDHSRRSAPSPAEQQQRQLYEERQSRQR